MDKRKSLRGGAIEPKAFHYDKDLWAGRMMYSLAEHYGFSLDTPWQDCLQQVTSVILLWQRARRRSQFCNRPAAKRARQHVGRQFPYEGIVGEIERRYRRYRKEKTANAWVEEYMKRVMVERTCPDCRGRQLKQQRLLITDRRQKYHGTGRSDAGANCAISGHTCHPLAATQQAGDRDRARDHSNGSICCSTLALTISASTAVPPPFLAANRNGCGSRCRSARN